MTVRTTVIFKIGAGACNATGSGRYSIRKKAKALSDHEWDSYIYPYDCRVRALHEERLEKEMGFRNYWRRKTFLGKYDEWREWGGR